MNIRNLITTIAFTGICTAVFAVPQSFDFKDPKGVNAVQFKLDSLLEPISGTANDVTGSVSFDAASVAATKGEIKVGAASLKVSNSKMTEHLLSDAWLDTAKFPGISFEFAALSDVKPAGDNKWTATAAGKLTIKGVTKEVSVPVSLSYLPGAFGKRLNKPELGGDLLVVRGEIAIKRADFGIKPGQMEDKVAPEVQLSIALVGGAPKS